MAPSNVFPPSDVSNPGLSTGPLPTPDLTCPAKSVLWSFHFSVPPTLPSTSLPPPLDRHLPRVSAVPSPPPSSLIHFSASQSESHSWLSIEFLPAKNHQPQLFSLIPGLLRPPTGFWNTISHWKESSVTNCFEQDCKRHTVFLGLSFIIRAHRGLDLDTALGPF